MNVSRHRFRELVAEAIDSLPEEFASRLDNVAVLVEDWPTEEQLRGVKGTLLGLYEGVPQTARSFLAPSGLPDRITVFRGPLCERAVGEQDLAHQVRVTIVHEVAHHFGIGDARLRELGWG